MTEALLPDGHVGDEMLARAADGDEAVPDVVSVHLAACEACTERLVAAAHLSVATGDLLRAPVVSASLAGESPRAVPWGAVGVALTLVLAGVVPALARFLPSAVRMPPCFAHAIPVVAHGIAHGLAAQSQAVACALSVASATVLMALGAMVSRTYGHEGAPS